MEQVTNITSSVKQQMQLLLENNETADFFLHYNARMQAWYFDFTYNEISAKNLKVCLHPNILRQFRRLIPFGITFGASNSVEPFQVTSFSSGACNMYILNKEEVEEIEQTFYEYIPPVQNKYIGDFTKFSELKAYSGELNNGNYAYVVNGTEWVKKYVYNGSDWVRA